MPLSNILDHYYFNIYSMHTITSELSELSPQLNVSNISSELGELANIIPTQNISSELNEDAPGLVISQGVNLATGYFVKFAPGDIIVRSNGTSYGGVTGISGPTGFLGYTGIISSRGETGLQGSTGIQGITGISLQGNTGILGLTGIMGATGTGVNLGSTGYSDPGVMGVVGFTLMGITGFVGITGGGAAATGITGITVQGKSSVASPTGIQGLTGISSSATGIQGVTGSVTGATGVIGSAGGTGIIGEIIKSISLLSTQTQTSGVSLVYALPGGTLGTNEDELIFLSWGTSATTWDDTTITITLGGSTILSKLFGGNGGSHFYVKGTIIRINATTQQNYVYLIGSSGLIYSQIITTSVDLTISQNLVISTTNGTITALVVRKVLN